MLSIDQFFEIFPKHNGLATISEFFCLKFANFCTIEKQITICSIVMQAQTKFIFCRSKINRVHFSTVSVCSNPCVGPIPTTNMSFFLLSV